MKTATAVLLLALLGSALAPASAHDETAAVVRPVLDDVNPLMRDDDDLYCTIEISGQFPFSSRRNSCTVSWTDDDNVDVFIRVRTLDLFSTLTYRGAWYDDNGEPAGGNGCERAFSTPQTWALANSCGKNTGGYTLAPGTFSAKTTIRYATCITTADHCSYEVRVEVSDRT
ncbi:MAG: hypothetical protein ACPGQL_00490 [Thermoplasmatota archaeon]